MAEKEYIERDSLAGKLIEMKYCSTSSKIDFGDVIRLINSEPTADVQEIVRCKDCKKFCPNLSFCTDNCIGAFGHCQITHMNVSPDFYCGHGEKRTRSDINGNEYVLSL